LRSPYWRYTAARGSNPRKSRSTPTVRVPPCFGPAARTFPPHPTIASADRTHRQTSAAKRPDLHSRPLSIVSSSVAKPAIASRLHAAFPLEQSGQNRPWLPVGSYLGGSLPDGVLISICSLFFSILKRLRLPSGVSGRSTSLFRRSSAVNRRSLKMALLPSKMALPPSHSTSSLAEGFLRALHGVAFCCAYPALNTVTTISSTQDMIRSPFPLI